MHELSNEPVRNSYYSSPEGLLIVAFSEFSHARTCFPSREAASLTRYAGTRVPLLHSALPLPRLQTRSPAIRICLPACHAYIDSVFRNGLAFVPAQPELIVSSAGVAPLHESHVFHVAFVPNHHPPSGLMFEDESVSLSTARAARDASITNSRVRCRPLFTVKYAIE